MKTPKNTLRSVTGWCLVGFIYAVCIADIVWRNEAKKDIPAQLKKTDILDDAWEDITNLMSY